MLLCLAGLLAGCTATDDDDSALLAGDSGDDDSAEPWAPSLCAWALEAACADSWEAPGATGEGFGDPFGVVNGVRGGGVGAGSFDVYSLTYLDRPQIVLSWSGRVVLNGPGVDFVVFENAFEVTGPDDRFMDPVLVEVSADGQEWVAFEHGFSGPDPEAWSSDPAHWWGFAGLSPVLLHEEDNPVDPVDPAVAGGDGFDLDDLPAAGETIKQVGARYVRLTSAAVVENPASGAPYPHELTADGADLDGVYAASLGEVAR